MLYTGNERREMTQAEALQLLADVFHTTRLTEKVYVSPEIIWGVLYGKKS